MKLIKINTDHYVIVDDSNIEECDWVYRPNYHEKIGEYLINDNLDNGLYGDDKKITHSTQPLDERGYWGKVMPLTLTISEIKELIGEVDVKKKAEELTKHLTFPNERKEGIIIGYNQALEDNKEKKYTDKDVIRIVEKSRETGLTAEYLMMTFQPKTEWEVEFDTNGKMKLK